MPSSNQYTATGPSIVGFQTDGQGQGNSGIGVHGVGQGAGAGVLGQGGDAGPGGKFVPGGDLSPQIHLQPNAMPQDVGEANENRQLIIAIAQFVDELLQIDRRS